LFRGLKEWLKVKSARDGIESDTFLLHATVSSRLIISRNPSPLGVVADFAIVAWLRRLKESTGFVVFWWLIELSKMPSNRSGVQSSEFKGYRYSFVLARSLWSLEFTEITER